jgi:hypothetical protein
LKEKFLPAVLLAPETERIDGIADRAGKRSGNPKQQNADEGRLIKHGWGCSRRFVQSKSGL